MVLNRSYCVLLICISVLYFVIIVVYFQYFLPSIILYKPHEMAYRHKRNNNERVPPSQLKVHLCYHCGEQYNTHIEYQRHIVEHQNMALCYQIYAAQVKAQRMQEKEKKKRRGSDADGKINSNGQNQHSGPSELEPTTSGVTHSTDRPRLATPKQKDDKKESKKREYVDDEKEIALRKEKERLELERREKEAKEMLRKEKRRMQDKARRERKKLEKQKEREEKEKAMKEEGENKEGGDEQKEEEQKESKPQKRTSTPRSEGSRKGQPSPKRKKPVTTEMSQELAEFVEREHNEFQCRICDPHHLMTDCIQAVQHVCDHGASIISLDVHIFHDNRLLYTKTDSKAGTTCQPCSMEFHYPTEYFLHLLCLHSNDVLDMYRKKTPMLNNIILELVLRFKEDTFLKIRIRKHA